MKNITTKSALKLIAMSLIIFSSCGKKQDSAGTGKNGAIMKVYVTCNGDIQSQVAVLTFLAVDTNGDLISIVNDSTGVSNAGPFVQNSDFPASKQLSFHSAAKVSSVSVKLAVSPKVYLTAQDQDFSMTVKIYFDGKLKDNQTFSYDQLSEGAFTAPKDFDYKVTVN
jgi:hypothetical protein